MIKLNIQAMLKQAKQMEQEITKAKAEIDQQLFLGAHSKVSAEVNGKKEVTKITIDPTMVLKDSDDLEMLEDMILLAINDALKKVELEINNKMAKYGSGIAGLF